MISVPGGCLSTRQTLDLGFVKLVALPFRVNWKQNLAWICKPWRLLWVLGDPQASRERKKLLDFFKFAKTLSSTQHIGLKSSRLDYTIEAIQTESFESTADAVEKARMRYGQLAYVQGHQKAVEMFYDRIVQIMVRCARKVGIPWAAIRPLGTAGGMAFVPIGNGPRVRGVCLDDLPVHIAPAATDMPEAQYSE